MVTMYKSMKKKDSGIPADVLPFFDKLMDTYSGRERDGHFLRAMEDRLTRDQRLSLFGQNGSCKGTGYDSYRKAFALEVADKPLAERIGLFNERFEKKAVLNGDNTITLPFACRHGYYKHAPKGKFEYAASLETYFEGCAGGRMYELEKALGIKLKIKSVDITPLKENVSNPVVFTFEVIG
jgi:hypothetical protein